MTTAELAAEINGLTSSEKRRVSVFASNPKKNRKVCLGLKPYTKAGFYAALKESRSQAARGETMDAYKSLAEIREKHGLSA